MLLKQDIRGHACPRGGEQITESSKTGICEIAHLNGPGSGQDSVYSLNFLLDSFVVWQRELAYLTLCGVQRSGQLFSSVVQSQLEAQKWARGHRNLAAKTAVY